MRALPFTLILLLLGATASSASVYKWVDDKGVTHYSDQPNPGAEKVQVAAPQSYTAPDASTATAPTEPSSATPAAPAAPVCAIASPGDDEVLMNTSTVNGSLHLDPLPRPGMRIAILLDGKPSGSADAGGSFTIDPIDRGTHTLSAQVLDAGGHVLCQSPSVTFHVRQPSTQAPNPANRPRF
jgi:hypothetical protein